MRKLLLILFFINCHLTLSGQDIQQGTWRTHFSYNNAQIIQSTGNKIFCAVQNGLFYVDLTDQNVNILTKIDGLNDVSVSAMGYSKEQNTLIIGYENGNIDLFSDRGITNIDLVKTQNLTIAKTIRQITTVNETAYLATDFGIVVIDLQREVIREVFREIGPMGVQPKVFSTAILKDSIFAATSEGFLKSKISESINLLDFNNWTLSTVPTSAIFEHLAGNSERLLLGNNEGIYFYENGEFILSSVLLNQIESIRTNESGEFFLINASEPFENQSGNFESISNTYKVNDIYKTGNTFWLADTSDGLIKIENNFEESIKPNGPSDDQIQNLVYQNDEIYVFGPFENGSFTPLDKADYSVFQEGKWIQNTIEDFTNASDISGKYLASFGSGILDTENGTVITSPPFGADGLENKFIIPSIKESTKGLWVANFNSDTPLHLLNNEDNWESYRLEGRADEIKEIVASGNIWMYARNNQGVIIFNPESQETTVVNAQNSDLPSNIINDITIDLEDEVWVATSQGVAFFPSASTEISNFNNAILPVFENNFLFRDETINCITVDPGNRKWIGTKNGAWLLEENGELLVRRFTAQNSPLPSDNVLHIAINENNGEVFIVTDKGMVSYRSDATVSSEVHGNVKIFPNPVKPDFQGLIGINGLANDVSIKITDISGKLIREIQSNGGGASWNLRDSNGGRAQTGVYLFFSSNTTGTETFVGKLAIIN